MYSQFFSVSMALHSLCKDFWWKEVHNQERGDTIVIKSQPLYMCMYKRVGFDWAASTVILTFMTYAHPTKCHRFSISLAG